MREILFRGKRIDNGEWVEGYYVKANCSTVESVILPMTVFADENIYLRLEFDEWHEVATNTVGQYTGLTANGKKIYEGDIFKFPDEVWESYYTSCGTEYNSWEVENFGAVGFCEDRGRFEFVQYKFNENSVEADLHENQTMEFYDFVRELEVIGNIHDNPELLEGGNT